MRKDGKQKEKIRKRKTSGGGVRACKTHLRVLLLFVLGFVAVAQEKVSHQYACVSLADVPILPVSPGREGDMDPLMLFEKLRVGSVSLYLACLYTWQWEEVGWEAFQCPVTCARCQKMS